jgi:hypothetical protein
VWSDARAQLTTVVAAHHSTSADCVRATPSRTCAVIYAPKAVHSAVSYLRFVALHDPSYSSSLNNGRAQDVEIMELEVWHPFAA